jgi:hypothetical protein
MVWPYVIAASLSVGWMLSPDVLVRLGNGIAENRTLYLAALGLSALASALAVSLIRHPELRSNGKCSQVGLLVQGIGRVPAMTLILVSRISLVLLIPTGLLVTAGFAFNEIFLFWFPNFGFAFLVLGLITLLHLAGQKYARMIQPVFAGIVLISLFILCLAAIGGPASSKPISVDIGFSFSGPVLSGALLLFLGFDYVTPKNSYDSRLPAFAALLPCLLLFLFWAMLSLQYVPAERLASTTIPHILAAKEILGQPGRFIIGAAVISGACGAVNALFHLATDSLDGLAQRHLLPGHPPGGLHRRMFVLVFAFVIGIFLMAGLAGHEELESYIQASLLLWLLLVGMQCLAAGRILKRLGNSRAWQGFTLGVVYICFTLYLAAAHDQAAIIIRFSLLALAATAITSAFWLWKKPVYELTHTNPEKFGGKP